MIGAKTNQAKEQMHSVEAADLLHESQWILKNKQMDK